MACWWPCCESCRAVYRLDSSGNLIWRKDWGVPFAAAYTNPIVRAIDTDDDVIYVGGTKSGPDYAGSFTVRRLDSNGETEWETDIGGDTANDVLLTPDGVMVGHRPSFDPNDTVFIQLTVTGGTLTNWSLYDERLGNSSTLSPSLNAAGLQAVFDADPDLNGLVSVSGASITSGFTLTYDTSLSGPTGYRQVPIAGGTRSGGTLNRTVSSSSLADLSLLDPADGTILWRSSIVGPSYTQGDQESGVASIAYLGSDYVVSHNRRASGLATITKVDSLGAVINRDNVLVGHTGLASVGSDYFGFRPSSTNLVKRDSSHSELWATSANYDMNNVDVDGSTYVWAKTVNASSTAVRHRQSDGGVDTSFSIGTDNQIDPNALGVLDDGGIILAKTAGVTKYASAGSLAWNYSDGSIGICTRNYQSSEVLFGSIRYCD